MGVFSYQLETAIVSEKRPLFLALHAFFGRLNAFPEVPVGLGYIYFFLFKVNFRQNCAKNL